MLEVMKEDKALDVSRDGQITEPEFERLMNDEVIGVTVQLCYIYKENSLSSYTEHNYSYVLYNYLKNFLCIVMFCITT
jgi:hypothetical protein